MTKEMSKAERQQLIASKKEITRQYDRMLSQGGYNVSRDHGWEVSDHRIGENLRQAGSEIKFSLKHSDTSDSRDVFKYGAAVIGGVSAVAAAVAAFTMPVVTAPLAKVSIASFAGAGAAPVAAGYAGFQLSKPVGIAAWYPSVILRHAIPGAIAEMFNTAGKVMDGALKHFSQRTIGHMTSAAGYGLVAGVVLGAASLATAGLGLPAAAAVMGTLGWNAMSVAGLYGAVRSLAANISDRNAGRPEQLTIAEGRRLHEEKHTLLLVVDREQELKTEHDVDAPAALGTKYNALPPAKKAEVLGAIARDMDSKVEMGPAFERANGLIERLQDTPGLFARLFGSAPAPAL